MDNEKNDFELNEDQKKAVFCTENVVVAAGAGSGKTKVLAYRFAWLLTEKDLKVDEILTLTFTKKAAGEMYKRIYSLISEIAENETGVKAQRACHAIDNFIHARIQTLDSYSASIVKQCAARYGISPDFQIDQDRCYNLALEIAYPFFISNRRNPAIEKLYSNNSPEAIVNIFADVLFKHCQIDKPRDFLADIKKQFNIICIEWKNKLDEIQKLINEIKNDIFEDNTLLPILVPVIEKYQKDNIVIPRYTEIHEYFNLLLSLPVESVVEKAELHPIKKTIIRFLNSVNSISSISLRTGKRSYNPVKENINKLRSCFDSFSTIAISCIQAGFIISIMSLFTELQSIYLNKKRAEGILTYSDIANLSRTILIEQNDIRQSEKESFKAIMIDEFQDNNELQKDILFLLAEKLNVRTKGIPDAKDLCPGKLFFVGDEKQSIYLFRGADVSVFRKLKDELKSPQLPLKINYRSSPHLIGVFNTIFSSVFAPLQNLPLYEASYTPLEAGITGKGNLTLCILNSHDDRTETDDDRLSPDENEAYFTAAKIKQLLNEKTEDGKQKYQPHDIAILFRTGTPQHYYEKHLRSMGIPYTCENINNLFHGGLVNDIISVLRLAAHPMDNASYAEMLRSPFAGLSIAGTALCLSLFYNDNRKQACLPFDDKPLKYLDEADGEKYRLGQKVYTKICKKTESENISSLVSHLWYNEGYRYETEWNPQTSVYREMFDYFFHLATIADTENQTLASFTDSMITFRENGGSLSEIEIPLERPSAVRLTTIHKSKGLEYPVVFLCCCGRKSQSDRCDIVYTSSETGIVFTPPPPVECKPFSGKRSNFFWEQASEETKRKRIAELRRLLYVGMTRAKSELYVTGSLNMKETGETDNFSLNIKNFINEKCDRAENYIEGDRIWNNDTLFGLLLPSIVCHIPDDGLKAETSFFNMEEIPVTKKITELGMTFVQEKLNDFIKKTSVYYDKAEIIKTPVIHSNHLTPVSLKRIQDDNSDETINKKPAHNNANIIANGKSFVIDKEFSGEKSDDIFNKVDSMLSRLYKSEKESGDKFNFGSFGTIAHICVEALLNKEDVQIPSNITCLLHPTELAALLEAGKELAFRFVDSPLGKIAKNADLRENEFSFRSIIRNKERKEIFINGTIDLFFEDKNCFHVVDFKTDSKELPGEHTEQMACYFHAITALFAVPVKKQCRIWLYYLRTGHAVEMTEKAINFDIEQRAFDN